MKELSDLLVEIRRRGGEPLALATVVGVQGHAYRRPGARMLMDARGPVLGSISGGCLEGDVFGRAQEVLASGMPRLLDYDLRGDLDLIWGSGSGCEGAASILVERVDPTAPWLAFAEGCLRERREGRIALRLLGRLGERVCGGPDLDVDGAFVEPILPPIALTIFGADAEAGPLAAMAKSLGWRVCVCDHRPAFAKAERFPGVDEVRAGHPGRIIPGLPLDARSAAVLLNHNYAKDQEALGLLADRPLLYIGLMGHRDRAARMAEELGIAEDRLYAPVGLDLGASTPETLALAIAAEIQAVFGEREGGFLRERAAAIHGARP